MRRLLFLTTVIAACAATSSAPAMTTPAPTLPKPQFDGYIALAQYRCMDFLCKEWSMGVSRLATECFTWDCQYEQQHLNVLDSTESTAKMDYKILTALDHDNRLFYTIGILDPDRGVSRLWTSTISGSVNTSTVKPSVDVHFPWPQWQNPIVSLEVSTTGLPIAIFFDGSIGTIDVNGTFTKRLTVLESNTTRQLTQATAIDRKSGKLFVLATPSNGSNTNDGWPSIISVDLSKWTKSGDANTPNMTSSLMYPPVYFEMNWVPQIQHLVVFATGNYDSILYMNATSANTTVAILDLSSAGNFVTFFHDNSVTKTDDTFKNNAFDDKTGLLFFQAHVESEDEGIVSLMSVGPFVEGPPQPLYWTNEQLSPLNFGYQGMHFIHCEGKCPT